MESAAFVGRCWSCSGSGGGQLRVFAAAGRPLEAALLPDEREYTRPCESAPALCYSTAFVRKALTYWICRAPSPVAVMLSAAARPATRLSIGVENSGRPTTSRPPATAPYRSSTSGPCSQKRSSSKTHAPTRRVGCTRVLRPSHLSLPPIQSQPATWPTSSLTPLSLSHTATHSPGETNPHHTNARTQQPTPPACPHLPLPPA